MKLKIRKSTSTKHSVIKGALIGVLCSLVMSTVLLVGVTVLAVNGKIDNIAMNMILLIIRACSVCVGILIAAGLSNENIIIASSMTALGYLLSLVFVNVIVFDSYLSGILSGLVSAIVGVVLGIAIIMKRQSGNNRIRKLNKFIVHN